MNSTARPPPIWALAGSPAALLLGGGKGASLARMARAGFPGPPGFLITTEAYRAFIDANALQASIVALAKDRTRPREDTSKDIRALFERASIPPEAKQEITRAYADLTQAAGAVSPLAVRSTATAEDLPGASFAGQHDSFLNIRGEQALLDAVKRCWASLWTARSLEYRARQGLEPFGVWMAVIVQQMVAAESSGVLFTANTLTGARNEIVLSASWGLGESIVNGSVMPNHIVADKRRDAIREIKIGDKAVTTTLSGTGTVENPVEESERRAQVLSIGPVTELVDAFARDLISSIARGVEDAQARSGAIVDGVEGDVRCDALYEQVINKSAVVIPLGAADALGPQPLAPLPNHKYQGRFRLRYAHRRGKTDIANDAAAVVHQRMSGKAQAVFLVQGFAQWTDANNRTRQIFLARKPNRYKTPLAIGVRIYMHQLAALYAKTRSPPHELGPERHQAELAGRPQRSTATRRYVASGSSVLFLSAVLPTLDRRDPSLSK